ncbi:MAG TPA: hypothetical protein VF712_18630 [Thermoleophilaceae bacterium]
MNLLLKGASEGSDVNGLIIRKRLREIESNVPSGIRKRCLSRLGQAPAHRTPVVASWKPAAKHALRIRA